jgi:hypothetical protein
MALEPRVDRLEVALSHLADAQARTEESMRQLAAAQVRTEERFVRLEEAQARTEARLEELATAQARTEVRMEELTAAQTRMAAAQARTEVRMEELTAAQTRMTAAQARTDLAVQALAQQVGRLADTIGFTLEDLAREVTPAYLAQHYSIHVPQLDRHFIRLDGQELELDLYGNGQRDGERVTVVGEVRSRIYGRDVEDAVRQTARLAPQLSGTPMTVLFGFVIHPSARETAQRLGAVVISSSGR